MASLLFSLQFFVDRAWLAVPQPPADALLLAFQLMQYEIVLFDASLKAPGAEESEPKANALRHGKSCLFEADADELAHELQRQRDSPLTLLLLAQERGRARLRAFASVPLELHAGLIEGDVLSSSMMHRVCEWGSLSGRWELRDHCNRVVGSVLGVATLSCLGKTLAPHLVRALGVQVDKSKPVSVEPSVERDESGHDGEGAAAKENEEAKADVRAAPAVSLATKETLDSSIQCDEIALDEDVKLPRSPRTGSVYSHDRIETRSPRTTDDSRRKPQQSKRASATERGSLFSRELPPPLFFQR